MLPIDFEGSNKTMGKPENMTDEECMGIRVMIGQDDAGYMFFLECWQPNREDIEAIVAGRPIWIKIYHNILPPVSIYTLDENNQVNE